MKEYFRDRTREYMWRSKGEDGQSRRCQVPSRWSGSGVRRKKQLI
jgi:hypothetical protein